MIKYILAIAVLTTGMAFAQNDPATARINKEVRHELVMLPYLDVFDNLAYRVGRQLRNSGGSGDPPDIEDQCGKSGEVHRWSG